MLQTIVLVAHVGIALLIIGLVLLQRGKGADAGTGFGAGASAPYSARAARRRFSRGDRRACDVVLRDELGARVSRDAANGADELARRRARAAERRAASATEAPPAAGDCRRQRRACAEPARTSNRSNQPTWWNW